MFSYDLVKQRSRVQGFKFISGECAGIMQLKDIFAKIIRRTIKLNNASHLTDY